MGLSCGCGTGLRWAIAGLVAAGALLAPRASNAQQQTFHLDRLEVPGAPDDGVVLFRPVTNEQTIVYGQLGLGLSLDSLRTSDLTNDATSIRNSKANVVTSQFSTYFSGGFELLDRLTLGFTLPIAWEEAGHFPNYSSGTFSSGSFTNFDPTGPAVGDMRFDIRYVFFRADDRSWALGGQLGVFVPTGAGSSDNFGGDGKNLTAWPAISGEWTPKHFLTLVANTGVDFRSDNSINDPTGNLTGHPNNGLGIGGEWRWAAGAFLPLKQGKYRIGGTIFGQTGITSDSITGPTAFTRRNTPIEWNVEGRMRLPRIAGTDHWYVGVGGGSLIAPGYGAPDLRLVALLGTYFSIEDTNPASPDNARSDPRQHPRGHQGHRRRRHPRRHRRMPDGARGPQGPGSERRLPRALRSRRRRHPRRLRQVPRRARGQGRHRRPGRLPRGRRRQRRHPGRQGRLPEGARPARSRPEEERLPEVHLARGLHRARAPAGALRRRRRRPSCRTASRCSPRSCSS